MSIKFGTHGNDIQTQDTTNIPNTDRTKICLSDNQDKQLMFMQSKIKYSARLDKRHRRHDLYS